ncbi:hypothetical protein ACIBCM_27400 [Streptomyces sp. NPDC051018]|uniref:hypothetical protein n=1 Tax=Streptomyces sp. NPDC051018 TaxID=3365639 RepID=UPI0037972BF0
MPVTPSRRGRTLAVAVLTAALALGATACQDSKGSKESKTSGESRSPAGAAKSGGGESGGTGKDSTTPAEAFPGKSGGEIATMAVKATKSATSLTLGMDGTSSDGPMRARIAISSKGDCAGDMSPGTSGRMDLIKIGDVAYMRFDEAFLRAESTGEPKAETDAVIAMMKGKWVKAGLSEPDAKDMLELCDLDKLLGEVLGDESTIARRAGETTVNGRKALKLIEKAGRTTYTIYVAVEGQPYILRLDEAGSAEPGTMTFSDYDKPVPAKKPPAGEILDIG